MNSYYNNDDEIEEPIRRINHVIDAVIARGYDDITEDYDDYLVLMEVYEFRKQVTFQLYESYFLPKRHEFEIQLLTTFVDAIVANQAATFLGGAVVGGVAGNAAYDILKKLLFHMRSKLKSVKRTRDSFTEIEENTDKICKYFLTRDQAKIEEICVELNVEAYKIEPLMKLLGYRCSRRHKRNVWFKPK